MQEFQGGSTLGVLDIPKGVRGPVLSFVLRTFILGEGSYLGSFGLTKEVGVPRRVNFGSIRHTKGG